MADKEERYISITQMVAKENIETEKYRVMPREEAIERMAKAICASNMAPDCLWECETCDRWKVSDKEAAEAALNALLGKKENE